MYDKWLYFHIFEGTEQVLMPCIREDILSKKDLEELAVFLAYYKQRYKIRTSIFEEGVDHSCENMKCVRRHIIDFNVKR